MAEVDRAINEILAGDSHQEKQSRRISHYESVKAELMETLRNIDEEERNAANEMIEVHARYGIASWDFDTVYEFQDRRKKAWLDYGAFLQKEKASLDKAKLTLMEQQENAEKLDKMKTVEGYLDVALDEWLSVQPVQIPPNVARTRSSITVERRSLAISFFVELLLPLFLGLLLVDHYMKIIERLEFVEFLWLSPLVCRLYCPP